MPAPLAAAAIMAGANTVNTISSALNNRAQRKWNEKMYDRQRADALADWNMQNAYNAPSAQMARFKEAGLNPNLIYGQSNEGATVRSTEPKSWQPDAPQFDASSVLGAYYDTQLKQQQIDTLEKQKTIMDEEARLKNAQTLATLLNVQTGTFDLNQKKELSQFVMEAARLNNNKLTADIQNTQTNTQATAEATRRMNELQPKTIEKITEEIKAIKTNRSFTEKQKEEITERINNMIIEGKLKAWELKQREAGINPNSPAWDRKLGELLETLIPTGSTKSTMEQFKEGWKRNNNAAGEYLQNSKLGRWMERMSPY